MARNAPTTDADPRQILAEAGWPDPQDIVQIEGGWDTVIWRFQTPDGKRHGLRLYRPRDGTHESARRELLAISAMRSAGLAAPEVEATGQHGDLPYFVMTWLPGIPIVTILEKKLWRLFSLAHEFGRLQARYHRLAPRELAWEDSAWCDLEAYPELSAAVRADCRDDALCHFDYHPLNVLADSSGITGVLDFSFSGLADRRADLGRTQAILTAAPIPPSPVRPLLQLVRKQFAVHWRRGYLAEAGDFPLEPLYEAWGGATFVRDIEDAVADGRGWGTPADIQRIKAYVADRMRAAGLA
ncbi:MAG TPA: aminoglycoside phosphotransferase family protein [Dehalococcoidia bacterium]|nr:aminoglycoside phosphotransferase family protein [Dehalococcoidia bacterium]